MDQSEIAEEYAALPNGQVELLEGAFSEEPALEATPPPAPSRDECQCVTDHRPAVAETDRHQIVPLAWGGADTTENVVLLCPTTHRALHALLDWFVTHQQWPPREVLYRFPRYVRILGARAVSALGGQPPPAGAPPGCAEVSG